MCIHVKSMYIHMYIHMGGKGAGQKYVKILIMVTSK